MYPEGKFHKKCNSLALPGGFWGNTWVSQRNCFLGPPGGERAGSRRRRPGWLRSIRSSSSDRPMAIPHSASNAAARR